MQVADELAGYDLTAFYLGKDEVLALPAVRGYASRKFDAAHVSDLAVTGLRGRYFDVAFLRRGSVVERALRADSRFFRVPPDR